MALLNGERNFLAFFQYFEASTLDSAEVNEYVSTAVLGGDEAVTFLFVEPFYGASSVGHGSLLKFDCAPARIKQITYDYKQLVKLQDNITG